MNSIIIKTILVGILAGIIGGFFGIIGSSVLLPMLLLSQTFFSGFINVCKAVKTVAMAVNIPANKNNCWIIPTPAPATKTVAGMPSQ